MTSGRTASTSTPSSGDPWSWTPPTTDAWSPTSSASGQQLHGEPFDLQLTGTAGGTFSQGQGGEHVEMDALDFVRTLAGRLPGAGVMRHPLPL